MNNLDSSTNNVSNTSDESLTIWDKLIWWIEEILAKIFFCK